MPAVCQEGAGEGTQISQILLTNTTEVGNADLVKMREHDTAETQQGGAQPSWRGFPAHSSHNSCKQGMTAMFQVMVGKISAMMK